MNSNNTKSFESYIKPIINGIFYERKKMVGGYNRPNCDYVAHIDNNSLLKSGIKTIVIENNYNMNRGK